MPASERPDTHLPRELAVPLDGFAWDAVQRESARLGVSEEDLVAYAVMYYLADVDSGRITRRVPDVLQRRDEQH